MRVLALIFFAISRQYPAVNQQIIDDPFHHYYLGIILILVSLIVRKSRFGLVVAGLGLGLLLEEVAVVLDDLGLEGFRFFYLNGWDFLLALGGILVLVTLLWLKKSITK